MTLAQDVLALIIATKDHPEELRRTLASVQAQSVLPRQVIVVDGGTRAVEGLAQEFPRLPILCRRVYPPGLANQQNAALECVEPSVTLVGFLDDDIVLKPGALEAMLAFWDAAEPNVGGAGFNVLSNVAPPRAVWLKSLFGLDSARRGVVLPSGYQTGIGAVTQTRSVEWLNSGTTVWRRAVVSGRPFDEWFDGPGHLYDVDFSYAVGRRCRLMVVAPAGVRELSSPHRRWDDDAFGRWQILNRVYFVKKHPELSLALCYWALVGQTLANAVRGLIDRDARFLRRARGNLSGWLQLARGGPPTPEARLTARTAERYGYLWGRSVIRDGVNGPPPYHFDRMRQRLSLPPLQGWVLDAGCGDGIDLASQARRDRVQMVGVELSEGGCRASAVRCRGLPADVIQGDVARLPFADDTFDFIYAYGVLHHLPDPAAGLRELVRVLKPGAQVAVYLYEDFSDRGAVWRGVLALVNALRPLTTRMPPRLLEALCRAAAPVVFLACVAPSRLARRIPGGARLAAVTPFRHARDPWSLWGDLYDRFATPLERRYSRTGALALLREGGLQDVAIAKDRGWMVAGSKPQAINGR